MSNRKIISALALFSIVAAVLIYRRAEQVRPVRPIGTPQTIGRALRMVSTHLQSLNLARRPGPGSQDRAEFLDRTPTARIALSGEPRHDSAFSD